MRDGGLERIETVVERQQRVAPECDNDGLLFKGQHRRARLLGAGALVLNRGALFPLGDGLRVDAVAPGQPPQALWTLLDRSTDRRSRRGAPVVNLAHSASFHSREKTAPSKPGAKQLDLGVKLDQALNERLALLAVLLSEALSQLISGVLRKRVVH